MPGAETAGAWVASRIGKAYRRVTADCKAGAKLVGRNRISFRDEEAESAAGYNRSEPKVCWMTVSQLLAWKHVAAPMFATLALAGAMACRSGSPAAASGSSSGLSGASAQEEADAVRATERERLRALVSADVEAARRLHADDFQLVNPFGGVLTKAQYLGGIASGSLDYVTWAPDPDSIAVRVYGTAAVIRYRSQLEIVVQGQKISRRPYWHTDTYAKRDGRWQVVWSQATEVK